VQDAFGNYVVQYFLDLNIPNLPTKIIKQLQGKLFYLSRQKFSSNVVEKCLKCGSSECVILVMKEILGEINAPQEHLRDTKRKLYKLLQDSYGNYVIQTCLSEGSQKAPKEYLLMREMILPFFNKIRNTPYAKRINSLLKIKKKKKKKKNNRTPKTKILNKENTSCNYVKKYTC